MPCLKVPGDEKLAAEGTFVPGFDCASALTTKAAVSMIIRPHKNDDAKTFFIRYTSSEHRNRSL
jgi:hypothetical protein